MFSTADLTALMASKPSPAVSLYLPTHVAGAETRQNPIRFKNLLAEAKSKLGSDGAEDLLAPATALVEDYDFWQHQGHGLAVFLGGEAPRIIRAPLAFEEQAVVGEGFHLMPMLPLLAADGAFLVLTLAAGDVQVYDASRFSMTAVEADALPQDLSEVLAEYKDYEAPANASPPNRPGVGSQNISNAQVMGDSPEEYRKLRLVEFLKRIASGLEHHVAGKRIPVVAVADSALLGHFRAAMAGTGILSGDIEANPASMNREALHAAAYEVVKPILDAGRQEALQRFAALLGSGDSLAVTKPGALSAAAEEGRVDTMLIAETAVTRSEGKLDAAAEATLRQGGKVFVAPAGDLPANVSAGVILRYSTK